MRDTITPFEELNIIDDSLANALAGDEKVGTDFVRVLVQGLLQTELGDNIRINVQRAIIGNTPEQRGIRLDIEVLDYEESSEHKTPKIIYDIEPNNRKDIDIVKHNRFYQAKIDSRNLASGERDFIKLPNLYVVTITNYDPFGFDYMLYTVHNKCDEVPELPYEDDLHFLYFNTTGSKGGSEALKALLTYIQYSDECNVKDEVTKKLHDYVSIVKISPEARMEYMMWEEKIFYEKRDAMEAGRAEGRNVLSSTLMEILGEKGFVTESVKEKIMSENDFDILSRWIRVAAKVETIKQFENEMMLNDIVIM